MEKKRKKIRPPGYNNIFLAGLNGLKTHSHVELLRTLPSIVQIVCISVIINQFPFRENWLITLLRPIDFALAVPSIDFALGSSQGSKCKKLYF